MTVEIETVDAADGHRFELRRFAAASTRGEARPGLLFVPALGVPAHKYDAFASRLADAGIDVAVHEWRGLASSSLRAGRGGDWGYRELFTDLDASFAAAGGAARVFGGHSLGGQFAAMLAARHPARCRGLALIASGVPYPATFPGRYRVALGIFAAALPPLVAVVGHFPGRRLRFAGREAAGVMRDWARTARSGRYAAYGDAETMEARLAQLDVPTQAFVFADDWLAPTASARMLLGKLGGAARVPTTLDAAALGADADHFSWLRRPDAVVARLVAGWPLSS